MTSPAFLQIELRPGAQLFEFDSSTREKSYRVELSAGKHFQINEKLYHLLACLHAPLSLTDLATEFQQRTGQTVPADQLQQLSDRLATQGIIVKTGQAAVQNGQPEAQTGAYLGLHYRRDLLSAAALAPLARLLRIFFERPVAVVVTLVIAAAHLLAYGQMGFPPKVEMESISWPLFYVIVFASIGLHELGHLAACRRWECPHGPLGVGLYFFNPVFYVDVTAAWRLDRWQRAVVDAGGIYLQLLCVPLFWLLFQATGDQTYLMAILSLDLMIISNLEPFLKLDGYWLLSDLTGVPNLHTRTGDEAKRAWSWLLWRLGRRAEAPPASPFGQWTPRVRWVIFGYIGLSMLLWPIVVLAMLPLMIEVISLYPGLWREAFTVLGEAVRTGDMRLLLAQLQVLFLPTLMLVNIGFLVKITIDRRRKARRERRSSEQS
jgi:putative peptide zinc metalloprotease protein